jgi:hypothetical protein
MVVLLKPETVREMHNELAGQWHDSERVNHLVRSMGDWLRDRDDVP